MVYFSNIRGQTRHLYFNLQFTMIAFMFQFHQARNTAAQNCVLALPRPLEGRLSFPQKMHAWLSKENKCPRWETHGCKWKICKGEWLRRPETCSKSVSGRTRGGKNPPNHSREVCILTRHLNGLGGSLKPPADPPNPHCSTPDCKWSINPHNNCRASIPQWKAFNLGSKIL